MPHHHLHSSPETCHWGFFEAKLKPVLTIASGDEVTIDTVTGGPDVVPDRARFHVPPELADIHARSERMVPGHILTGPVAVDGAQPGDVLEVDILDVQLRQDWGYNLIRPLAGTLPGDFHETRILNIPPDRGPMVGRMPWGVDLPLKPFFGDQCVVRALRDMIVLLGEKRNLSREDAYTLCSLAADLRVTQTVNGSKGIHCMIAKAVVHG